MSDGRIAWRWIAPAWPCRVGFHFLAWNFAMDAYACPCSRHMLRAEDIR